MSTSANETPQVTNLDPDREKRRSPNSKPEVPELNVQSLEDAGSMLALDTDMLDPDYTYRWVNIDPRKVGRAKARGYVFVDAIEETLHNTVGDSPEVKDGRYTTMDVVLMKCRKTVRAHRRKKLREQTSARLKGQERKFRKEAAAESKRYSQRIEVITDKE